MCSSESENEAYVDLWPRQQCWRDNLEHHQPVWQQVLEIPDLAIWRAAASRHGSDRLHEGNNEDRQLSDEEPRLAQSQKHNLWRLSQSRRQQTSRPRQEQFELPMKSRLYKRGHP